MTPVDGRPGYGVGIGLTITGLCLLPLLIVVAFQLLMRQTPILKICKEGVQIRKIEYPFQLNPLFVGIAVLLIPLQAFWILITYKATRTKTYQIAWSKLNDVQYNSVVLAIVVRPNDEALEYYEGTSKNSRNSPKREMTPLDRA